MDESTFITFAGYFNLKVFRFAILIDVYLQEIPFYQIIKCNIYDCISCNHSKMVRKRVEEFAERFKVIFLII